MTNAPLAELLRPNNFNDLVGYDFLIGVGKPLRNLIEQGKVPSLLLWGPPGTGKTTLARIIAVTAGYNFSALSGAIDGLAELREIITAARKNSERQLVLVDEIHRFNKTQQDAFLPHIESGLISIIGQTTENVSFRIRNALLSRLRVIEVKALSAEQIYQILIIGIKKIAGLRIELDALKIIAFEAAGDARRAINNLEWLIAQGKNSIKKEDLETNRQPSYFDSDGDKHFDTISAFIKALRGSDPEAALYYMLKAIDGGEDPLFITRRMIIFASEDASCDPRALEIALNVDRAVERIGLPEAKISLAQGIVYLALCAKSNASYLALNAISKIVEAQQNLEIPRWLRNAPTKLMRDNGNGSGYNYPHDSEGGFYPIRYLPEELGDLRVFKPTDRGIDLQYREKIKWLEEKIKNSAR